MKKIKIFTTLVLTMLLAFVSVKSVNAVSLGSEDSYSFDDFTHVVEVKGSGPYELKLIGDENKVSLDIVFGESEVVTLDLNGHTLTNFCDGCSAIWIKDSAKVTIIDSSAGKTGKVTSKDDSSTASPIVNESELTVEGGSYETLGGHAGLSTVVNKGKMTVNGGKFLSKETNAAAIHNEQNGTLVINGGEVATGVAGSWGITNNGTATINDGTFVQKYNFSVIQNAGTMTIEDGEFKADGEGEHYALITNQKQGDGGASLSIKGGNYENGDQKVVSNAEDNTTTISDGTFSNDTVSEFLSENSKRDEETGEVIHLRSVTVETSKNGKVTSSVESAYRGESVVLETTADKGYELDKVVVKTKSGAVVKVTVSKGSATFEMPDDDVTVTTTFKKIVENPETFDNIMAYVGIATMSTMAILGAALYLNKKAYN